MTEKTTILHIYGTARGGGTIVGRILGQMRGFQYVGEARNMFSRRFMETKACGCGTPFLKCEFWLAIGYEAFGGWDKLDLDNVMKLRSRVDSKWAVPQMALPWKPSGYQRNLREFSSILDRLYTAVNKVSGARVVIDTSHSSFHSYAAILQQSPGIDLRLVHLVRDSRGVAYSKSMRGRGKDAVHPPTGRSVPAYYYSPLVSSLQYLSTHQLGAPSLRRNNPKFVRVRYEDLMDRPREYFSPVLDLAQGEGRELPLVDEHQALLADDHIISGNQHSFKSGLCGLKADDEWMLKMGKIDKGLVTALTWPVLWRNGYLNNNHRSLTPASNSTTVSK